MKTKKLRHSWARNPNPYGRLEYACSHCGCLKRWDQVLGFWIYITYSNNVTARPSANVLFNTPTCVHPENSPKPK